IPISTILSGVVDFAIQFVVLLGLMWYFKITPTSAVWILPFLLLLAMVTALGVGLWLAALNVLYRDVGYVLPFLTQLWFYVTPIVYSSTELPENLRLLYALNPMVGVVDGFRWALLGTETAPGPMLAVSALISVLILISGLFYFRRMERTFADMV
ncbi:MAG: ABC transporter permease, partial [Chloroflexi bacterium]|nr:ABC transporter permease [Chloroflexota bacterium]